ncbi:MAG: HD domain-containing protein [Dactylosporangium sp.]|nr:HD domain-containing protein [Dactylosporangium sp.]NNJ61266.1 HD domain-containing protein [Dactylosporangium sp.]
MPLRTITDEFGEEGLRARFTLEIGRFDPPERQRLNTALGLATDLHRNDRRVQEPYINHLLRVSIRLMCHYQVHDADVIIAGVLHDAVEDHPSELAGPDASDDLPAAACRAIERQFGQRVAALVASVTNPEFDRERDADEQYREHLAVSLESTPWARVIKASDFTDNGVGVIHTTRKKARRVATKYRPLVPILRDLINRPDTPLSDWVKRHIFDQLDLAEERFETILSAAPPPSTADPTRPE